jgi:hypothetical protein
MNGHVLILHQQDQCLHHRLIAQAQLAPITFFCLRITSSCHMSHDQDLNRYRINTLANPD